jgi:hypothetical protein
MPQSLRDLRVFHVMSKGLTLTVQLMNSSSDDPRNIDVAILIDQILDRFF